MILGRNHFLLGSAMGLGKWIILPIGLFLLFIRRKSLQRRINIFLVWVIGLVGMEANMANFATINLNFSFSQKKEVSIITYNLFFKNTYPDQIISEILKEDVDILAIQEVTPTWSNRLNQRIASRYPYRKTFANKGTHGLAIFSKYPIKSNEYLRNSYKLPFAQYVEIEIEGKKMVLANGHLASPAIAVENPDRFYELYEKNYAERKSQIRELISLLEEKFPDSPKIIAGDLNTMRMEPIYRDLAYEYFDLFQQKGIGLGFNFPNTATFEYPIITLDYILFRGDIKPVSAKVLPGSSSDHLAIKGIIAL